MKRLLLFGGLAFLAAVLGAAINRARRPTDRQPPTNVLLITIDTLRPDRLHCYGHQQNRTPHIDGLAAQGVRFENAFCDVTWTSPSMASVMTGSYATRHGFRSTYQQLDPANVTLAQVLKQYAYHTAAVIGSFPLDASFGFNQGFDEYDDHLTTPIVVGGDAPAEHVHSRFSANIDDQRLFQYLKAQADAYRPDHEVSDAAVAWLTKKPHEPFFFWAHYFGPHELNDVRLTPEQQNDRIVAAYDGDVERTDAQVGRLLAALDDLGLTRRTLVILHADHGQSLGEHWYIGHGRNLYDPTLRVPLIVRYPGPVPAGAVVQSLARNVDIMPTVLDLARIPAPQPIDGESLQPLWKRWARSAEREVYCETYLPATEAFRDEVPDGHGGTMEVGFRRRGLRTARWMFVINEPWPLLDYAASPQVPAEVAQRLYSEELYDIPENLFELSDGNVTDRPDVAQELRRKIADYAAVAVHGGARRELDAAAKERLRSLGYMQ